MNSRYRHPTNRLSSFGLTVFSFILTPDTPGSPDCILLRPYCPPVFCVCLLGMTSLSHASPYPPSYADLAPNSPRFAIYDDPHTSITDKLPGYVPSINHIGLSFLKLESISPLLRSTYDGNDARMPSDFEPVILELNSTQLNVYRLEDSKMFDYSLALFESLSCVDLDPTLNVKDARAVLREAQSMATMDQQNSKRPLFKKGFGFSTQPSLKRKDLATNKYRLVYNLLNFKPDLSRLGDRESLPSTYLKALKSLRGEKLKSYTLQRLVIGNASDYARKPFTLRLRVEKDQLLMCSYSLQQFMEWYFKLSYASDVSLPLESRDLPHVRTVPRRSRRNRMLIGLQSGNGGFDRTANTSRTTITQPRHSGAEALQFEYQNGEIRRNTFSSFGEVDQEVVPLLSVAGRSRTREEDRVFEEDDFDDEEIDFESTEISEVQTPETTPPESIARSTSISESVDDEVDEEDEEDLEGENEFFSQSNQDENFPIALAEAENSDAFDPLEPSPISQYCTNSDDYESRKDQPLTLSWAQEYKELRYMIRCIRPLREKTKWIGSKLVVSQSFYPPEIPQQETTPRRQSDSKTKRFRSILSTRKGDFAAGMTEYRKRSSTMCIEYCVTTGGLTV
ncbi:unnamed protein product [Kuraishia capsulata CBS 1993]|uniref:PH domain-containing protein n=1 Tax=Kuraishia capsulata CBS 1993 TaxID=1382522 RepID=W6MUN1_9ASCO|nr:uncharacterized protein KUCA_T00001745001 [Kuraishia capsulata CBS 1993]CDK25775.1 unnamed protein product [Kuraishia capsulata CBS 1993]